MIKRRVYAKSVTEFINDLNMRQSWLLALDSLMGYVVLLLTLAWSTIGWTAEKAAVRCARDLESVVPACPMEMATNPTLPQCFLRAAMRGGCFSVFSVLFVASEVTAKYLLLNISDYHMRMYEGRATHTTRQYQGVPSSDSPVARFLVLDTIGPGHHRDPQGPTHPV